MRSKKVSFDQPQKLYLEFQLQSYKNNLQVQKTTKELQYNYAKYEELLKVEIYFFQHFPYIQRQK